MFCFGRFVHQLQSVSTNFTRSTSEPYLEIPKWQVKLLITLGSSKQISEFKFEIKIGKFILCKQLAKQVSYEYRTRFKPEK